MRAMKLSKSQKGFTLIELMAATFIAVLFAGAFFAAFYVMRNELYHQNVFFTSNRGARFAVEMITRDAKEAIGIVATRGGDTTASQVLILRLPSIDNAGEPTNIDADYDYVVYKLDSNSPTTLIRDLDVLNGTSQRNGGADSNGKIIARNVTGLAFSNTAGTGFSSITNETSLYSFNSQITAQGTTLRSAQTQTAVLDSNVRLRNKPNG